MTRAPYNLRTIRELKAELDALDTALRILQAQRDELYRMHADAVYGAFKASEERTGQPCFGRSPKATC